VVRATRLATVAVGELDKAGGRSGLRIGRYQAAGSVNALLMRSSHQPGGEKTVHPMHRQGPQVACGCDQFGVTGKLIGRNRFADELRMARQETLDLPLALFGFEGAGAVDQFPTGSYEAGGMIEKSRL
jgi:hypothetical protein